MTKEKNLEYFRINAEEDYIKTPISVLRYIMELERNLSKSENVEQMPINSLWIKRYIQSRIKILKTKQ